MLEITLKSTASAKKDDTRIFLTKMVVGGDDLCSPQPRGFNMGHMRRHGRVNQTKVNGRIDGSTKKSAVQNNVFVQQARAAYDYSLSNFLYTQAIWYAERMIAESPSEETSTNLFIAPALKTRNKIENSLSTSRGRDLSLVPAQSLRRLTHPRRLPQK